MFFTLLHSRFYGSSQRGKLSILRSGQLALPVAQALNRLPRVVRPSLFARAVVLRPRRGLRSLFLGGRGRPKSVAVARLTFFAPSGSESAPLAMQNFGSLG